MLLILTYHRVGDEKFSNQLPLLESHLEYLSETYSVVLPEEPLAKKKLSLCLTFDDAFFDFYHYVFPLLQKFKIRALLSVPTKFILETTDQSVKSRLSVPYYEAMKGDVYQKRAPFCTFEELSEMVSSGCVEVASHSHSHLNLTNPGVDVAYEMAHSQKILEERLPQKVSTFIFPFGKANAQLQSEVSKHYTYSMRIGSALNWGWHPKRKVLNRVNADNLHHPLEPFRKRKLSLYYSKALINYFR
jgi:peptidoglycan/xylan/chitin deacetylase (PgdA/CDA1 family)